MNNAVSSFKKYPNTLWVYSQNIYVSVFIYPSISLIIQFNLMCLIDDISVCFYTLSVNGAPKYLSTLTYVNRPLSNTLTRFVLHPWKAIIH